MNPGSRPHLDHMVGGAHRLLVVLDHQHRIAQIPQTAQGADHLLVVFGMQADARLVEHVEHAHQAAADLRGEPDALRLAARKRADLRLKFR